MEGLGRSHAGERAGPQRGESQRHSPSGEAAEGCWRGVKVLVTGHTGFKGAWLSLWLSELGADVYGLSLAPDDGPNLYTIASVDSLCASHILDIRNRDAVARLVAAIQPEVVFHLAARSLVLECLQNPAAAFATNVLGTTHLLEALRNVEAVSAILVATSDKVYANDGGGRRFIETDPLGGADPYSASKAACEQVVAAYRESYFRARGVGVATARAGNVLGGGDFGENRLAPDCVRAALAGAPVRLRRPGATRPWQHVFDCLAGYLRYAALLRTVGAVGDYPPALNFGPLTDESVNAQMLAEELMTAMSCGKESVEVGQAFSAAEAGALSVDASLSRRILGFAPLHDLKAAVRQTADWTTAWRAGEDMQRYSMRDLLRRQDMAEVA